MLPSSYSASAFEPNGTPDTVQNRANTVRQMNCSFSALGARVAFAVKKHKRQFYNIAIKS